MSGPNSFIRNFVTSALSTFLDIATVIIIIGAAGIGYALYHYGNDNMAGVAVGVVTGIIIVTISFGVVYLIIEITEQLKELNKTIRGVALKNQIAFIEIKGILEAIETHISRLDNTKISDLAAKSVNSALNGDNGQSS
jgi:hypothetical protein